MRASLPEFSGRAALPGLQAEVRIYRDAYGVPHIFANNSDDAFMALGMLHASDRLFQMEMTRRAGAGRLAEVLGKNLIERDINMRTLGFNRLVEENYKALSPQVRQALQDYANGVNAVLTQKPLPPEFLLLGFKPEPWRAQDCLYWAKLMAWQLSGNMDEEIFRSRIADGDIEKAKALYFTHDGRLLTLIGSPVTVAPEAAEGLRDAGAKEGATQRLSDSAAKEIKKETFLNRPSTHPLSRFEALPHQASNAFVLSGSRTESGKPLLANDPHLELNAPIVWYLARIVTPDWEIKGASAPGVPFFALGQTKDTAWGFTTSGIDVQDLVFADPEKLKLDTHAEKILVKGETPVMVAVRMSPYGPVVSDAMQDVAAITPPGKVTVLQYTGLRGPDRTIEALYEINFSRDAQDIEAATQLYTAPPQNLFYADKNGHTGFIAVGAAPQRDLPMAGFMPQTDSGAGEFFWHGDLSSNSWPRRVDPANGYIFNANNAPVNNENCAQFSCALGFDWGEPYRARRLLALLQPEARWNVQQAAQPMLDIVSLAAHDIGRLLIAAAASAGGDAPAVFMALQNWKGDMEPGKPEPLIYSAWFERFLERLYPGIKEEAAQWPKARLVEYRLRQALVENLNAPDRKKVDQAARATLEETLANLRKQYGAEWRNWRWGAVHKAPFKNLFWSRAPGFRDFASLAAETGGDAYTLKRGASLHRQGADAFLNEHGAGYRAVYDLGNPDKSLFIIATGESGHILSNYYGNLLKFWLRGAFITLAGGEAQMKKAESPQLVLSPAGQN